MIRKLNRAVKNWLRPKRIALGRVIWDRRESGKRVEKIDLSQINSILFMRYDGKIGDMVVNTLMFREIKKRYPHIEIGVVTRGAAIDIIKSNPYVDEIYKFEKGKSNSIDKRYDLLIDFSETLRVNEMKFINLCKAKFNMGLDKGDWKLFDLSVEPGKDFEWNEHITQRYAGYLRKLGIENPDLSYEIFIPEEIRERAEKFFSNISEEVKVILNPYGASKHKNFNSETLKFIVEKLREKGCATIFVAPPDKREEIEKLIQEIGTEKVYFNPEGKSILESASFIERSDLVITPDTSIVHIGTAFKKRVISVYPPNGGTRGVDHLVWSPLGEDTVMLFCREIKNSNEVMNINSFQREEMENYIETYSRRKDD